MILFLKIFLAHLAGDFLLQPVAWVRAKETKKLAAWQLYAHALLHGLLVWLLVWEGAFWKWALLIAGMHLVIDAVKIILRNDRNQRILFFLDQIAHLLSIYLVWLWYYDLPLPFYLLGNIEIILLVTSIILLTTPVSFTVKNIISKWTPDTIDEGDGSLQSAGKYIGILERLFIFVFILLGQWQGVGFLLAAKSIFRFGDLKESKDRKLTEYILIGTLVSFGTAIITGLVFNLIIRGTIA